VGGKMQDNQRKAMFSRLNSEQGARQSKGTPFMVKGEGYSVKDDKGKSVEFGMYVSPNAFPQPKAQEILYNGKVYKVTMGAKTVVLTEWNNPFQTKTISRKVFDQIPKPKE
jgi:hypothetical protein